MVEIRETESGHPTALIAGVFLHSPRDPVREAGRIVQELVRREPPCIVVLGFGLGYVAEAILTDTETTEVVVFEPDSALSEELLAARPLESVVGSPRLHWCRDLSALRDVLPEYGADGFEVLTLSGRVQADPDIFKEAEAVLGGFKSRLEINGNTLKRFGRRWIRNLCQNIGPLQSGVSVSHLSGLFRGMPGLLLAAGPGLDQVLDVLPELADRAVVVAVDTAVSMAEARGVTPDIAVVVDPQYWNARHLDRVEPSRTILVAESSTHRSVFRHFRTPHLFCRSLFPLGQVVESAIGELGALGTGGSVSTTAWDLTRFAGCRPIFVAGLDLGFPDGQTHFRGSFFEQLAVSRGHRLHPAEQTIHGYIRSAAPFEVPATGAGTVLTDKRMDLYRSWFERQLADPECPPTFTLSSGGARIAGMSLESAERLREWPVCRTRIESLMDGITSAPPSGPADHRARVEERLRGLLQEIESLQSAGDEALEILDTIELNHSSGKGVDFAPLGAVDSRIRRSSARAVVSFLMHEAIGAIRSGFGSGGITEQISASRSLYKSVADSADFHASSIREALEKNAVDSAT